ncbi:MAG: hypothetical protein ACRYGG_08990 [Janthinobacterium lividum]
MSEVKTKMQIVLVEILESGYECFNFTLQIPQEKDEIDDLAKQMNSLKILKKPKAKFILKQ